MIGQPARAFAGLCIALAGWTVARVPTMQQEYSAFIAATRDAGPIRRPRPPRAFAAIVDGDEGAARPRRDIDRRVRRLDAPLVPKLARIGGRRQSQMADARPLRDFASLPLADAIDIARRFDTVSDPPAKPLPASLLRLDSPATSGAIAERAYALLSVGDRRGGARLLGAAIAMGNDPRATAWTLDRDALRRRWSASGYVIARDSGGDLAARPVLGGGQAGAGLAYSLDPLARRPVSLVARVAAPVAGSGIVGVQGQAAVGATWRLSSGLAVAAERLVPLGRDARGGWTVRAAGGASARRFGIDLAAYAEAGFVGRAVYAATQGRADVPLAVGGFSLHPGAGAWASEQHDGRSVGRLDAGPGVRLRHRALPVELSADYRFRLAGNADPGSGVVITVSTAF